MIKNKKLFIASLVLIAVALIFTVLIKTVDVQPVGPNDSLVGFASLNHAVAETLGVSMTWYHITTHLGFIPLLIAAGYAIFGLIQFIHRKSLKKVDRSLFVLAAFYVVIAGLYILFEKLALNYRPALLDGELEASYPSTHTLIAICFCASAVILNRRFYQNRFTKIFNIAAILVATLIVFGRFVSGVHWCTDILGGIIISAALLTTFATILPGDHSKPMI